MKRPLHTIDMDLPIPMYTNHWPFPSTTRFRFGPANRVSFSLLISQSDSLFYTLLQAHSCQFHLPCSSPLSQPSLWPSLASTLLMALPPPAVVLNWMASPSHQSVNDGLGGGSPTAKLDLNKCSHVLGGKISCGSGGLHWHYNRFCPYM